MWTAQQSIDLYIDVMRRTSNNSVATMHTNTHAVLIRLLCDNLTAILPHNQSKLLQIGPLFGTAQDAHPEHGTSIGSALALNQTLQWLNIGSNGLSAACGEALAVGMSSNRYTIML
jgi:hypothetical protein